MGGHNPYTISTLQRKIASTNCCMHFRCSSIQRRQERSYRQKCVSCPTIWGKRREIGRWAVCQHRLLNGNRKHCETASSHKPFSSWCWRDVGECWGTHREMRTNCGVWCGLGTTTTTTTVELFIVLWR